MNPKIVDWSGKRVWLVGASSGIGAALAGELARRGARVALSARSVDKLRALGIEGAVLLPCDATDTASLAGARKSLFAAWRGVDLVIYLAGDYVPMRAGDFDLAVAEKVVTVNFNGAMRLAATVLPDLQAGGGIVFVASVAGYRGLPKALAYGPCSRRCWTRPARWSRRCSGWRRMRGSASRRFARCRASWVPWRIRSRSSPCA